MGIFTVYGSWGELTCDADTGIVLAYSKDNSDWEKPGDGYEDITRVDVTKYRQTYGFEAVDGMAVDIIYIGFWTTGGQYEEPAETVEQE